MKTEAQSRPTSEIDRSQSQVPGPIPLEPARCALCNLDDAEPIAVGEDFEYHTSPDEFLMVKCRRCGLIYLNPRPAAEAYSQIYPDHYHAFQFDAQEFGLSFKVRRYLETRRLLKWCKGLPEDARILDVGCGDGFHLHLLQRSGQPGWKLEGVDLDPRAVTAAVDKGLTVHQGRVEDLNLEPGYHLILMIMTIEHLEDPIQVLRSVHDLLVPGGRVVLVTDNVASPDFFFFGGRHWGGYHFPRHTYLFSRKTLARLADECGLDVVKIKTAMSPVNQVYSIRNWINDWGAPRWLVNRFSLKSTVSLSFFTLVDMMFSLLGCGAILQATFQRPAQLESK